MAVWLKGILMEKSQNCLSRLKCGDRVIATGTNWAGNEFTLLAIIVAEVGEGGSGGVLFETEDKQGLWVEPNKDGVYEYRKFEGTASMKGFYVRLDLIPNSINMILDLEGE